MGRVAIHRPAAMAPAGTSSRWLYSAKRVTAAPVAAGAAPIAMSTVADPASATPSPPGVNGTAVSRRPTANAANVVRHDTSTCATCRQAEKSTK